MSATDPLSAEAEQAWGERQERAALERAIALWARAADETASARTWVRLAEARHLLGASILAFEWGSTSDAAAVFAAGKQAADHALGLPPTAPDDLPPPSGASDTAAALYWRARNAQDWAATRDHTARILVTAEVVRDLRHVAELNPTLDQSGPDRHLGAYYAAPPSPATRDLERARAHFERARERVPGHLPTAVLEAATLTVAVQDRARFEDMLQAVIEADAGSAGYAVAEGLVAQRRATHLLARAEALFE